jgi:hypothetical protein
VTGFFGEQRALHRLEEQAFITLCEYFDGSPPDHGGEVWRNSAGCFATAHIIDLCFILLLLRRQRLAGIKASFKRVDDRSRVDGQAHDRGDLWLRRHERLIGPKLCRAVLED